MTARKFLVTGLTLAVTAVWALAAQKLWNDYRSTPQTFANVLSDADEIVNLLPELGEAGVGIGNAPFPVANHFKSAMMFSDETGCMRLQPHVYKTSMFIRTNLYEPFDPLTAFHNTNAALPPKVKAFLDKYGF